jgi:hypothetical protein
MKSTFTIFFILLNVFLSASELAYFDVQYEQSTFYIYWQTYNENATEFHVYISADGYNYELIDVIDAYNDEINSYELDHSLTINSSKYYFKLVELVQDSSNLLAVAVVNNINKSKVFYPTFTRDIIKLNKDFNKHDIQIFDCFGQLVEEINYSLSNRQLNVKKLTKGRYFIVFNNEDTDLFIKIE